MWDPALTETTFTTFGFTAETFFSEFLSLPHLWNGKNKCSTEHQSLSSCVCVGVFVHVRALQQCTPGACTEECASDRCSVVNQGFWSLLATRRPVSLSAHAHPYLIHEHTLIDTATPARPLERLAKRCLFAAPTCSILPPSDGWCSQTNSANCLLIRFYDDKHLRLKMTNSSWDVILSLTHCIFRMAANDAEGLADASADE